MNDFDTESWQLQQKADEEALQQAALEALQASLSRPLTEQEAMALAYSAGVPNEFYRGMPRQQGD